MTQTLNATIAKAVIDPILATAVTKQTANLTALIQTIIPTWTAGDTTGIIASDTAFYAWFRTADLKNLRTSDVIEGTYKTISQLKRYQSYMAITITNVNISYEFWDYLVKLGA